MSLNRVMNITVNCLLAAVLPQAVFCQTVSYWAFDSTDGGVFVDSVGNNDLVANGAYVSCIPFSKVIANPEGLAADLLAWQNTGSVGSPASSVMGNGEVFAMTDNSSWTLEGWILWDYDNGNTAFIAATRSIDSGWAGWELGCISG
jgi:hypothetical protein